MRAKDWLDKHFIDLVMSEKPYGMSEQDFASDILNLQWRSITSYRVEKGFDLKGSRLEGGVFPVEGIKTRCYKGEILLVRKDTREPFYTVETHTQVFRLSIKQWAQAKQYIKPKRGYSNVDGER